MNPTLIHRALRLSAWCALVALCLMVWGVLDSRPITLVVAMTVGQGLGTLSFAVFCTVVFLDLRRAGVFSNRARRSSDASPESTHAARDD